MKIFHFIPHLRKSGNGIVNAVVDLAIAQAKQGHTVTVCAANGDYVPLLARNGVVHQRTDTEGWKSLKVFARLRSEVRLVANDEGAIIHTHTLGLLLVAFTAARRQLVHTLHNPWQRASLLARFLPRRLIVLSDRAVGPIRRRATAVVENGIVGSARYELDALLPRDVSRPALVTVCGLYERKGVQDLIAAVERTVEGWHLYVVGEGPYRSTLEARAASSEASDRIHIVGFDREPLSWIAASDAFALVSHSEGGALVLTEARMLRRPVVYTTVGDMPSMMRRHAGIPVPASDVQKITDVLNELTSDPERSIRAANATQSGLEWYHVDRVAAQTIAVYEGALA